MSLANASQDAPARGKLAELWIYPIKSCAGLRVPQARLLATGLQWDRHWMLVDPQGRFVTQRTLPRMAHVHMAFIGAAGDGSGGDDGDGGAAQMQVRMADRPQLAPLAIALAVPTQAPRLRVQVWKSEVDAIDEGDAAAQWFSQALGQPLRLVRFDNAERRVCSPEWPGDKPAHTQFADGFPLLVTTEASMPVLNARLQAAGEAAVDMRRFRANLVLSGFAPHAEDEMWRIALSAAADGASAVANEDASEVAKPPAPLAEAALALLQPVKPCTRCPMPDVDPDTAQTGRSVRQALKGYRADASWNDALTFGQNAIVLRGEGELLRAGMLVQAW